MASTDLNLDREFDVMIVGAGPAGCVLASRLSEESHKTILLVEAGPDATTPGAEHPDLLDPFALTASKNAAFHWPSLTAGSDPYIQGYGVGGGSSINGMGVDRGQPGDFDQWRDRGATGWSWAEVLPYFKKLEHDLDFSGSSSSFAHGASGPMPVRRVPRAKWPPFVASVTDALESRGFLFLQDYTGDFRNGVADAPMNCLPERRVSAAMAYLTREVRARPNLKILPNATVERLSLTGRRADGAFARVDNIPRLLRAREVLVSCGAIQNPALLMRSGIGPAKHLASHGVPVVRDMPGVGANLQNHPCVALTTLLSRYAAQQLENPFLLQNWLRFSSHHPGCGESDMHLMSFNKGDWHELGRRIGALVVTVMESFSKGRVELSSADPDALPKIDFNLLSDARDTERLVSGVRLALELLENPGVLKIRHQVFHPYGRLIASLSRRTTWNGLKARAISSLLDYALLRQVAFGNSRIDTRQLLSDNGALRTFVQEFAQVQYHVCGTCRMGAANDPEAVVDGAGRVHGIDSLRVADASIFPSVPRGYTHFIVIMAAEKLADTIRLQWQSSVARMSNGVECDREDRMTL